MTRRKLSEFRAKQIIYQALNMPYHGWQVRSGSSSSDLGYVTGKTPFVIKVDQAVKGRFKKGLVLLDVPRQNLAAATKSLEQQGFTSFLVEPFMKHDVSDERYLSISRDADGLKLYMSDKGGVDIETHPESVKVFFASGDVDWKLLIKESGLSKEILQALIRTFEQQYATFLEINPYIIHDKQVTLLDLAIEVDDAAQYLVDSWDGDDMREPPRLFTSEEASVRELNETSPASFTLQVINPDGALFLLLSGGGASVVVADELYNAGLGEELANYGEYSGNPAPEETYLYASAVFSLLLASKARKKVLFIGGAVANFTNIEKTFDGIIKVIHEHAAQLRAQNVKIVVRRGGPYQKEGLAKMKHVLSQYDLLGAVCDPSVSIGEAVQVSIRELRA